MKENPLRHTAEHLVGQYFTGRGLRPTPFGKKEVGLRRTPDLRVFDAEGRFGFYCEVKSIEAEDRFDRLFKGAAATSAGPAIFGGWCCDRTVSRLADRIHHGTKQLRAVNPRHEYPGVLAIVNNDRHISPEDFRATVTGYEYRETGPILMYPEIRFGRLRYDLPQIDLFLWFDQPNDRLFHLFTDADPGHHQALFSFLGVSAAKIHRLPVV